MPFKTFDEYNESAFVKETISRHGFAAIRCIDAKENPVMAFAGLMPFKLAGQYYLAHELHKLLSADETEPQIALFNIDRLRDIARQIECFHRNNPDSVMRDTDIAGFEMLVHAFIHKFPDYLRINDTTDTTKVTFKGYHLGFFEDASKEEKSLFPNISKILNSSPSKEGSVKLADQNIDGTKNNAVSSNTPKFDDIGEVVIDGEVAPLKAKALQPALNLVIQDSRGTVFVDIASDFWNEADLAETLLSLRANTPRYEWVLDALVDSIRARKPYIMIPAAWEILQKVVDSLMLREAKRIKHPTKYKSLPDHKNLLKKLFKVTEALCNATQYNEALWLIQKISTSGFNENNIELGNAFIQTLLKNLVETSDANYQVFALQALTQLLKMAHPNEIFALRNIGNGYEPWKKIISTFEPKSAAAAAALASFSWIDDATKNTLWEILNGDQAFFQRFISGNSNLYLLCYYLPQHKHQIFENIINGGFGLYEKILDYYEKRLKVDETIEKLFPQDAPLIRGLIALKNIHHHQNVSMADLQEIQKSLDPLQKSLLAKAIENIFPKAQTRHAEVQTLYQQLTAAASPSSSSTPVPSVYAQPTNTDQPTVLGVASQSCGQPERLLQ